MYFSPINPLRFAANRQHPRTEPYFSGQDPDLEDTVLKIIHDASAASLTNGGPDFFDGLRAGLAEQGLGNDGINRAIEAAHPLISEGDLTNLIVDANTPD